MVCSGARPQLQQSMCKYHQLHPSFTIPNLLHHYRNKQYFLRDMFDIGLNQTPKIVMLHRGHTYEYHGDIYDQEALVDFAVEKFHDSRTKV